MAATGPTLEVNSVLGRIVFFYEPENINLPLLASSLNQDDKVEATEEMADDR